MSGLRRDSHLLQFLPQQTCPKCQSLSHLQWLADRRAELLPVAYFHVVFTVPAPIAAIAQSPSRSQTSRHQSSKLAQNAGRVRPLRAVKTSLNPPSR
jgi:Transposase zinc-binding domain